MDASDDDTSRLVQTLVDLMDLRSLGTDRFEGDSENIGNRTVFGGQLLGQALMAASRTVEPDRAAHSLHAYFVRGAAHAPIAYDVRRMRDGRSFSHRQIVASQKGRTVFEMSVSFQSAMDGVVHQEATPVIVDPVGLRSELEDRIALGERLPDAWRRHKLERHAIEYRLVEPIELIAPTPRPTAHGLWLRAIATLPDDPVLHRVLLAYASDYGLLRAAMRPHGLSFLHANVRGASLDHALWFHGPFRTDDWLLHALDAPVARGGRALCRGSIFTKDGTQVASTMQEGLLVAR